MTRPYRFPFVMALLILAAVSLVFLTLAAAQDNPPGQQNQPSQQGQDQTQQQPKPKKKGGFFSGLKQITGSSSEQTSATASAGAKGIGDGEKIANVTPTAADRQAVFAMDHYSVSQADLARFIQNGNLESKQ